MLKASHLIDEAIEKIKAEIDDVAVIGCSGGIDSSVATVLAHRAVGDLLHCVYVDTGMMRKDETENVSAIMSELGVDLTVVEASERFFHHLKGVTEPEAKRHIIGEQFIRVFEEEQRKVGAKYLVQGTI
ncbi:MAG: glutamine-hydrolyzing GMP synthase subunit GuaA, partial [Methanobacteriota archaeon]